jgi:hypothetical protein
MPTTNIEISVHPDEEISVRDLCGYNSLPAKPGLG